MPISWREWFHSISFRLLAGLFLLLGVSITASLYGIWTFERDRYSDIAQDEAVRAARTVERALHHAMLENDWEMIRQTVADVHEIVKPAGIGILDREGQVVVAGDQALVGRRFIRDRDQECLACHRWPEVMPDRTEVFMETAAGPVLRNVIKIVNEPACHACHDPGLKNLGIFIYDAPMGEIMAMLRTVLVRTMLTGLVTFLLVTVVLTLIVRRYLHRPLQRLGEGFIQVGRGNFEHWVEVEEEGEVRDMAEQFNVMNQAIKRSFAEIKRKNWETEQLYAFVRQLGQVSEWRQLRRVITDLLPATFAAEKAALLLRREKGEEVTIEISWRIAGDRRYYHREYGEEEEAEKLPPWLMEVRHQRWRQPPERTEFGIADTLALAPLSSQQVFLGLLVLWRPAAKPFNSMEKKLLTALVEQIEIALANARLYRLAITDGLTGLYGKRFCLSMINKFLESHAEDPSRVFAVLMLDLDFFKQVNDTHGHQVGDEVLVQMAELLRRHVRQDDVACRYGGEEFIVLVAGGIRAGEKLAQRLCQSVAEHPFACSDELTIQNTISIGVAAYPDHGATAVEVIGAADQALYRAKDEGRNRYITAGAP